jgi:hypothetical protein
MPGDLYNLIAERQRITILVAIYHRRFSACWTRVSANFMSFLREIFGPSRYSIWQQFAAAFDGDFTPGAFWSGGGKVEAKHGQWGVTPGC